MIILDPDRDGCTVWLINSPVTNYVDKVTYIKGNTDENICKSLISRLAEYREIENQWGYYVAKLCWKDCVLLDIAAMGRIYKEIFKHYGLSVLDVIPNNANNISPVTIHID